MQLCIVSFKSNTVCAVYIVAVLFTLLTINTTSQVCCAGLVLQLKKKVHGTPDLSFETFVVQDMSPVVCVCV